MHLKKAFWILFLFLIGCTSSPPAPVIDRTPAKKSAPLAKPIEKAPIGHEKDWRPDGYTVKKGDTLYSIGLQYGFDYHEIAQANNIPPPYNIHIGQFLDFKSLKAGDKTTAPTVPAATPQTEGGVVVIPLQTDTTPTDSSKLPPLEAAAPLLTEPKAIREPYSELAMAAPPAKPKTEKPAELGKVQETGRASASEPSLQPDTSKTAISSDEEDAVDWGWPTNGKVIANFNEGSGTKGIDIGGSPGQPITAAAAGKVIYSGADLRGYGKLVIIKHNKTYLSVYAHNSQILVKEGQQVSKGQKIAEMGNTDADRVKLHFEIRKQGKSVDPAKHLSSNP